MARQKKELPATKVTAFAAPDALEDGEQVENWADKPDSEAYEAAEKLYKTIVKGYQNKEEQADHIQEYWSIYSATPDDNAMYEGNSQGYIPAVRDATNARAKRCLKQLFPANMKHVDGLASDGKTPYTQLALLEHYIRKTRLKSTVRSSLVAGDVTGQWNLMLDWTKAKRSITRLVKKNPTLETQEGEDISDLLDVTQEVDAKEQEEVIEEGPEVVDFATEDLVVIPPTCMNLQVAHAVSLRLRLSPDRVKELVDEGLFILPENTEIEAFCMPDKALDKKNPQKKQVSDAGIKTDGTDRHALIFMVWTKLDFGGEHKEEGIIYYAGQNEIVGIIKNPLWSGKRNIISAPIDRLQGSFFGQSKVEPVKFLQWQLNDFHNMGQDSAMYAMLPITAMDPMANPAWASSVIGLGAVWPVKPESVKFLTFPEVWKGAAQNCDMLKRQIWESMDVNEAMMGKMPAGRKNNQLMGQMAQEQQTNISDHANRYEEEILNPLLEMLFEFDQQFRTDDLMIEQRGEIGVQAALEIIPPSQWGERYFFRWAGSEYMQSIQRGQQEIAWMNVLKGIPPQQMNGKTIDVTPILERINENLFGAEMAPRVIVDKRNFFTVPAEVEDEMLHNGFEVETHEADDDIAHLQVHMRAAGINGDPQMVYKKHMMSHAQQLQKKREMQMQQQQPAPMGGMPGGPGGAGPGVAGAPRPGAMPAPGGPRPAQGPPGSIQQDAMPGAPGRG